MFATILTDNFIPLEYLPSTSFLRDLHQRNWHETPKEIRMESEQKSLEKKVGTTVEAPPIKINLYELFRRSYFGERVDLFGYNDTGF